MAGPKPSRSVTQCIILVNGAEYVNKIVYARYINWIFHLSCDMLVQKNSSIGIVRAMRLASELSMWTDSFYNTLEAGVIEAF
jgi:hypothetical protein